jgi:hypothetical protein
MFDFILWSLILLLSLFILIKSSDYFILYAEKIGISYSGAKSRVQRAKLQIKQSFKSCCMFKKDSIGNIFIDESEECTC